MQNKISRRQFLQVTGASAAALLLAGLPVEASAASGHLTVTPDTLVSDLRADPTFAASGVWTWQSAVDSPDTPEAGTTLSDYVGANMAQDSADALNDLADTYEAGTQVTYKVYSPEEIAADATRDGVELYYWPSEVPAASLWWSCPAMCSTILPICPRAMPRHGGCTRWATQLRAALPRVPQGKGQRPGG